MKNITKYIVISSFLLILSTPHGLLGATNTRLYNDGSLDSGESRGERFRQYRRQSSELQKKIDELDDDAVEDVSIPVLFGVGLNNISPNFGDPRSGGRTHEGEDIMAVSGTPIVSPTEAVVIRTGVGPSEGNYVYTANPGGETFVYMHLDEIGEGVENGTVLKEGDLIGYVGNTGNAIGGAAHLHFEIHNDSSDPVDPFPRLTEEFSVKEKIAYLEDILDQTSNEGDLAELLVRNFRSTFVSAKNDNIDLPSSIEDALDTISASSSVSTSPAVFLPSGDLDIGSSGSAVINLQKYLIQAAVGPSALNLASAGATGYFGTMTKAALLEYQKEKDLSPANGYYGSVTRKYISDHPFGVVTATPALGTDSPNTVSGTLLLSRDLYLGRTGEDVLALQKFLNNNGFVITASGPGSIGSETTYFGGATESAVIRFQTANNISPAAGYIGAITRAKLSTK